MPGQISYDAIPANLRPILEQRYPAFRQWVLEREAARVRIENAALEIYPAPDQAYEAARFLRGRMLRWDAEHKMPLTSEDVAAVSGRAAGHLRLG